MCVAPPAADQSEPSDDDDRRAARQGAQARQLPRCGALGGRSLNVSRARVYELGLKLNARLRMRETRSGLSTAACSPKPFAALMLRLKGYAIVARRCQTPVVRDRGGAQRQAARLRRGDDSGARPPRTPPGRCRPSSAAASSERRILAGRAPGLRWPRHRFRRGAGGALAWPRYIANAFRFEGPKLVPRHCRLDPQSIPIRLDSLKPTAWMPDQVRA